jgi:glutamate--cysteine ligase
LNTALAHNLEWLSTRTASLKGMRRGLEKESLRVTPEGRLAQTGHHAAFGSALTHPSITTDYSEALIELITPATESIEATLGYLDDIHRFVYAEMGDEQLWVNSMPCLLGDDSSIPLAQFGSSNIGRMKTLYRHGLGVRYGRKMQTIAGIHYNLSFPDSFWQAWQEQCGCPQSFMDFRSERYFTLVRNFQRHSWLLLYLLGASPAVCKSFLDGREHGLQECGRGTLYLPMATSLRMSSLGYQNTAQRDLQVSYNALPEYVRDLSSAIRTPFPPFAAIGLKDAAGEYQQISTNVLQIENEYYGLIRPKRTTHRGERPTVALRERGVEYVELRCVDLNPFNPIGIDATTAHFLEVFALHALLSDAAPFTLDEYSKLPINQQLMVEQGRNPALQLTVHGREQRFLHMAATLLREMQPVAAMLDAAHGGEDYARALKRETLKLENPAQTYSAAVLAEMKEQDCSFFEFGKKTAEEHARWFRERPLEGGKLQQFRDWATASHREQTAIEAADTESFPDFLDKWFQD